MSTVTTRLCQYGHTNCYKHMNQAQVIITDKQHRDRIVMLTVEGLLADGLTPTQIIKELGFKEPRDLRRVLARNNRDDLLAAFPPRQPRPPRPRCARDGCDGRTAWIEDKGLDPDDEPIAHWNELCAVCQKFEDLCEDLLFLLDPRRGNETNPHRIAGRLGYQANHEGVESLRRALERHHRIDLRDMLHTDRMKDQRGWSVQGTVRSEEGNRWLRLAGSGSVRAHERYDADPGRMLVGSMFK